jgi:CPA2 family monovalent cation:H+ antiporter-2
MNHLTHELQIIINIALVVGVALIGGLIAHSLNQSPLVGYLLAGMIVGPFTPGLVLERAQIGALAEVGVIFLMFALGVEFSLKELARVKGPAIIGTTFQVLLMIAAGFAFGQVLGWSFGQSIFFGGVISISSTMVILKTLISRGEMGSNHGRLLLGMLIVQDLATVLLILLLPKVAGGHLSAAPWKELAFVTFKAIAFIAVTLLLGTRVVPKLMSRIGQLRSNELFLLTAVFLALGSAAFSAWLGLSPALGAFMAGLLLTETEFEHRVLAEKVPMRDLFATLFFVSMGMLVDVSFVMQNWLLVVGAAAFVIAAKTVITCGVLLPFQLGAKTTLFTGMGMISLGEFSFVLAQAGHSAGVLNAEVHNLVIAASLPTILLAPAAFHFAPRVAKNLLKVPLLGNWLSPQARSQMTTAEMEGVLESPHAVVVGYGRVGRRVARGLKRAGLSVIVIEQDWHLVRELQRDKIGAIYGDGSYPSVFAAAHPENARMIVVTLPDFGATRAVVHVAHRANPDAIIVARAQRSEHDVKLREAGATTVVVPEHAGAFMLLEETLLLLGLSDQPVFTGTTSLTNKIIAEKAITESTVNQPAAS